MSTVPDPPAWIATVLGLVVTLAVAGRLRSSDDDCEDSGAPELHAPRHRVVALASAKKARANGERMRRGNEADVEVFKGSS
jgi:hypothetical protein